MCQKIRDSPLRQNTTFSFTRGHSTRESGSFRTRFRAAGRPLADDENTPNTNAAVSQFAARVAKNCTAFRKMRRATAGTVHFTSVHEAHGQTRTSWCTGFSPDRRHPVRAYRFRKNSIHLSASYWLRDSRHSTIPPHFPPTIPPRNISPSDPAAAGPLDSTQPTTRHDGHGNGPPQTTISLTIRKQLITTK